MVEGLVAFLDILGFSQMVADYEKGDESLLNALKSALEASFSLFKHDSALVEPSGFKAWKKHIQYRSFSDCICITVPLEKTGVSILKNISLFFQVLATFQVVMLQLGRGYSLRGGVSVGKFYIDDNMIFSKALIEAYELESKKAIFPRIIISARLLALIGQRKALEPDMWTKYSILTSFEDEYKFVNFLNYSLKTIEETQRVIENQISFIPMLGHVQEDIENRSLEEKSDVIDRINKSLAEKLQTTNYPLNVENKINWLIRFLERENDLKTSTDLAF